ncbi:hypothetical protein FQN51_007497 [Onygenales sp. PD_10]|nr:hypothetical protein FQN51_007497 [Onygenales sp. PD_10]
MASKKQEHQNAVNRFDRQIQESEAESITRRKAFHDYMPEFLATVKPLSNIVYGGEMRGSELEETWIRIEGLFKITKEKFDYLVNLHREYYDVLTGIEGLRAEKNVKIAGYGSVRAAAKACGIPVEDSE